MSKLLKNREKKLLKKTFNRGVFCLKNDQINWNLGSIHFLPWINKISPSVCKFQDLMKNKHFRPTLIPNRLSKLAIAYHGTETLSEIPTNFWVSPFDIIKKQLKLCLITTNESKCVEFASRTCYIFLTK